MDDKHYLIQVLNGTLFLHILVSGGYYDSVVFIPVFKLLN
jgi:hypothetical protein